MCKIVSTLFYDCLLKSDISRKHEGKLSIKWINVDGLEEYDEKFKSYYNNDEINKIIKLCDFHKNNDVMILSSYNSQLKLLNKIFDTPNILVRTIDASQGSESSIVIISLVRSNMNNQIGFLSDVKRMCVSLSRAKNLLYIVGNMHTFEHSNSQKWRQLISLLNESM